ncbi:hypothetical protein ACFYST_04765 [Kitasatospora sp. NPDC004614]|uniref:hypothetical protein n=1 Tax=unclassified Kitasatospora TaxID=2633591 RepID=UPI0036A7A12E
MGRSKKIGVLVGPLLLLVGVFLGWSNIQARCDFAGAPRVQATVLSAHYKPGGTNAFEIILGIPEPVPVDDIRTAPDHLMPGDTVTALVRPGHALLPEQLSWSTLVLPVLFAGVGLLVTVVGVRAIRADPPTGPTDPEAWL